MTSPRKTAANRANARRSTGPRTAAGRARSSRNATRHGLSVSILADARLSSEVLALAHSIAAAGGHFEAAVVAAETTFALRRIRDHRHHLLASALTGPNSTPAAKACAASHDVAVPATATWCLDGAEGAELETSGAAEADGQREASALRELALELRRLDRYERRALSRRSSAIRRLTVAHAASSLEPSP
jgi:hypothetical protein